jgi:ribose/xylose/arabinose/galactoside ABC-type transport system permease subunit
MLKRLLRNNEVALLGILILIIIFFSIFSEYFFTADNLFQISAQMVELGLVTLGMSIAIISGGMDLSIGPMASLTTVLMALLITVNNVSFWPALLITTLVLIASGLVNGFLCGVLGITPMLATLGSSGLFSGIALALSSGNTIKVVDPNLTFAQVRLFGIIPYQFFVLLAAILAIVILMRYTMLGRRVYMIGTDPTAAKFSGIRSKQTIFITYIISAIMALLCGLVMVSRFSSARADVGDALVLRSIAAAVLGGVSIKGGLGEPIGAIIGVTIFSVLANGMNMLEASPFLQQIIVGALLLLVLAFKTLKNRNNSFSWITNLLKLNKA